MGRVAGGVFRFRDGLYFCLFGNGKFAGLRSFEDRNLLHRAGADSRLGWRGVIGQQHHHERHVRTRCRPSSDRLLHLPALLLPSLNSVGAEVGKPVSPQTASVGVSTSKLVRSEGQVIRHNMPWTLIMLAYLILIALLFHYAFPNLMSQ